MPIICVVFSSVKTRLEGTYSKDSARAVLAEPWVGAGAAAVAGRVGG